MLRRSYLAVMLGMGLYCSCAAPASAQRSDPPDGFYEYARNKIGLLRYCRDQGLLGQVTADRAAKAIEIALGRFAAGDELVKERGDRAEKLGEAGFWQERNGKRDFASVAERFGATLTGLCQELGGQTRSVQPPPVAAKVARPAKPPQARSNANHSAASIQPASPPTVPTEAARRASPPAPSLFDARTWGSPFEVNKWRLDRRERPWKRGGTSMFKTD